MSSRSHSVCGWGYEGKSVEDLLAFAHSAHAGVVVDVRLNALSRRPGFSKRRLSESLQAGGIEYVHVRDLGNPRENRPGFAEPGTPAGEEARARFQDEVLASPVGEAALAEVARLAERGPVVVLCFEADQSKCHRSLVIDALNGLAAEPAYS